MKARDIMEPSVAILSPFDRVERAIALLVEHQLRSMPVVDRKGRLLGVLSEGDLLALLDNCSAQVEKISRYMSTQTRAVDVDAHWAIVLDMFRTSSLGDLPVTRAGTLVGHLPLPNLLRAVYRSRDRFAGLRIDPAHATDNVKCERKSETRQTMAMIHVPQPAPARRMGGRSIVQES